MLDFGDPRIIDDTHQRLLHGFTMWRFGQLLTVVPQDPEMLALLAEFYAGEGLLVAFEEPTWAGRTENLDYRIPSLDAELTLLSPLEPDDATEIVETDDQTELVSLEEMTDLSQHLEDSEPEVVRIKSLRNGEK